MRINVHDAPNELAFGIKYRVGVHLRLFLLDLLD